MPQSRKTAPISDLSSFMTAILMVITGDGVAAYGIYTSGMRHAYMLIAAGAFGLLTALCLFLATIIVVLTSFSLSNN